MKTKFFLIGFILTFFLLSPVFAEEIPIQLARKVGLNFYYERISLVESIGYDDLSITDEFTIQQNNSALYYVFNINNRGFIMVAAEDGVYPVLGYSFNGVYTDNNFPPAFAGIASSFKLQIIAARENQLLPNQEIIDTWAYYSSNYFTANPMQNITSVTPLITSIWNQGCFFNDSCPLDPAGPCGNVVTGCVAVAMAQLINYYEHPVQGTGSHSYTHPVYGVLSANFGATTYNYAAMPDTVTGPSPEVARLMSHCGIAVDMNYSPSGSGAGFPTNAFMNYFNYKSSAQLMYKNIFTDSIWAALLRFELDSAHPLFYVGSGSGAHAFICDGYQGLDHFHFNWGWGGAYNGYFYLSSLNPGTYNFSVDQSAIFGLQPSAGGCSGLITLIAPSSTFDDGSGQLNYTDNSNCSWLITPPGANYIALTFDSLDLVAGDTVFIFDGSSTLSPLLGKFSGNTLPPSLVSTDSAVFILFHTDTVNTAAGWTITYSANLPGLPCSGQVTLINNSDTISDGSGPNNDYWSYSDCRWLIQPPGALSIILEFISFATEANYDFVDVYDGANTNAPLLGSYSGTTLPPVLTSSGGSMYIHFTSDGALTDSGWTAYYKICEPVPIITGNPGKDICFGDSTILSVPAIYQNYAWNFNGNPIPGANSSSIIVYDTGTYNVDVMNSCNALLNATPIYVGYHPPATADAGKDTSICFGTCITLVATGGVAYYWSTSQTTDTISVCPTVQTMYYVTVTDSNGCVADDSVEIMILPLPSVSITGYDTAYCPNSLPDSLIGLPAGGIFSGSGMTGGSMFDPSLAGPGIHTITYTYTDTSGCVNDANANLLVLNGPPAIITPSVAPVLCEGNSVILHANVIPNYTYQWYYNGMMIPGASSTQINTDSAGNYSVLVTDNLGCSNMSNPLHVYVNLIPSVYIGNDTTICFYQHVTLNAGPGYDNYLWSTGAFTQSITVSSNANNTGPKNFSVIVTRNGCVAFDTITVTFDPCAGIEENGQLLQLALYPNPNDGKFIIAFANNLQGKYLLKVFDLYGRIVYHEILEKSGLESTHELSLNQLRNGIYFLSIEFDNIYAIEKFIVK